MRAKYKTRGLNQNVDTMEAKSEVFIIHVTKDSIGCTLSIGSEKDGKQYTIPFDYILKELSK